MNWLRTFTFTDWSWTVILGGLLLLILFLWHRDRRRPK